jgi:hypothetical protein
MVFLINFAENSLENNSFAFVVSVAYSKHSNRYAEFILIVDCHFSDFCSEFRDQHIITIGPWLMIENLLACSMYIRITKKQDLSPKPRILHEGEIEAGGVEHLYILGMQSDLLLQFRLPSMIVPSIILLINGNRFRHF